MRQEIRNASKPMDVQKVSNFKNALSIVAACYSKLIWDKMNVLITPALIGQCPFDKVNEICEQMTLCTDLFGTSSQDMLAAFNIQAC